MRKIVALLLVVALSIVCVACTTTPGGVGAQDRKVGDQRLTTYTPMRRLTYRNACGSEGALTVCIDRIIMSDSAVVVEARIKNGTPEKYVLNATDGASVLLADKAGRTLNWDGGNSTEYPGLKEKIVRFRMEGHFGEEPYAVMINGIKKMDAQADHAISVVALLGE
jgi:hypothetical protein